MIKQITLVLFFLGSSLFAFSQNENWREMMNNPSINFRDVQEAFYLEFDNTTGSKGSGWKQFKRWEWFMNQRLDANGKAPNQRLIFEEVKRARLQQEYRGETSNWQLIGPIEEPQNNDGRSIGRISALTFHPSDTNQMWVGAPSGGIWKSDDYGESWYPLDDQLPNLGVSDIVIHPSNPDTIYMSTGDGSSSDTYTYGILKSVDGGTNWDTTGLSFGVSEAKNIRRLLLDSLNPSTLIAAATDGIYRSTDAGETWNKVANGNFTDLEFKPTSTDTIYAAKGNSSGVPFYLSYDNGQSWNPSSTGLSASDITRMKIAVTSANPSLIYAVTSLNNGGLEGVYKSEDAGASWVAMSNGNTPNMMNGDITGQEEGGQGWYSMDIAVSPINPDEIKIGGINMWQSFDGGNSYSVDAHWFGANGIYLHADQHRLLYHPITKQFYAGNDGGLYKRSYYFNGYESISTEMSITQFYRLANSASDPTIILAGAQDNGTFRWWNNFWQAIYGGDGMEPMVNPENPNIMYCATQRGGLHKSTDGGSTFASDLQPADGAWVTPFMMEPGAPEVLYAASGSKVYRSDAAGSDWYELSPSLTTFNSGSLTMFDVSYTDTEYLVAGSRSTIYITKDLGGEWTNIKSGLPNLNMTYVAFDPLEENTVWVTFSGYNDGNKVFRSLDAGETWENMSFNLPNLPVNCIEIERSSTGGVYVGTDVGVYYWDTTLSEWEPFMTGLPNVIVNELEIHESTNMIRAATYGRGLWESETRNVINVGIKENTNNKTAIIYPNPTSDFITVSLKKTLEPSPSEIIDAYGRTVIHIDNLATATNFSVSHLATGLYYLRSTSGKLFGRFIVQRD